ncbi:hypothetical protein V2W45_1369663 [Cenococcum geophilum]
MTPLAPASGSPHKRACSKSEISSASSGAAWRRSPRALQLPCPSTSNLSSILQLLHLSRLPPTTTRASPSPSPPSSRRLRASIDCCIVIALCSSSFSLHVIASEAIYIGYLTTMADDGIKEGDQVSWQWSGSRPSSEVAEVKEHGELSIQSNKGNTIKKNADPEDPAVHIAREGNDAVKRAREIEVEEHANGGEVRVPESEKKEEEEKEEEKKYEEEEKQNGVVEATESKTEETKNGEVASEEAKTGEKRKAEEPASEGSGDGEGERDEASEKKQKTEKANGAKKSRGRPKKGEAAEKKEKKAPAKKREPKKAATENGEPRRSARNRS